MSSPGSRLFLKSRWQLARLKARMTMKTGDWTRSMEMVSDRLSDLGYGQYIIWITRSGLGDKLSNANITSALCEQFGLQYAGIVPRSIERFGRHNSDPENSAAMNTILGFDQLPSRETEWNTVDLRHLEFPEELAPALIGELENKSEQASTTLCLRIGGALIRRIFMEPERYPVKYLNHNPFTHRLSGLFPVKKSAPGTPRIVFHLRQGDVSVIDFGHDRLLIPFYFGREGGGLQTARQLAQLRRGTPHELPLWCEQLRQRFGNKIHLALITDGYAYTMSYVNRHKGMVDHLRQYGIAFGPEEQQEKASEMKQALIDRYTHLVDEISYGEGPEEMQRSLALLTEADVVLSSSGNFAASVLIHYSRKPQLLMGQSYARVIERPGLEYRDLSESGNWEILVKKIEGMVLQS